MAPTQVTPTGDIIKNPNPERKHWPHMCSACRSASAPQPICSRVCFPDGPPGDGPRPGPICHWMPQFYAPILMQQFLCPGPARFARAAVAMLLLLALVEDLDGIRRLARKGLAGDGQAPLGVGAHLVEGGLMRPAHLFAVGAGLGAGVDVG